MNDTETHQYFYGETSETHSLTHTHTPLRLGHFHTDARFGAKQKPSRRCDAYEIKYTQRKIKNTIKVIDDSKKIASAFINKNTQN